MLRPAGTLALGLALVAVAGAFGSPSLYVPGVALAFLAIAATGWVMAAATGASVERVPGPPTVEEGREWPIRVEARTGLGPAPGGEVREPLLRGSLPMAGRSERCMQVPLRFERRGRRRLEPARLVIRDPLGLLERELLGGRGQEVLVLPRVEPVVFAAGGGARRASGASGGRPAEVAAEVEMESLRPYRAGAPASRIHWPTVARVGTLMERRLLADSDSQPLVVIDPTGAASEDALDAAVRAAAALCVHLARAGGCSLLLPGDRRATDVGPDLGGWAALHARLALVEAAAGAPRLRTGAGRGTLFWVSGGARIPKALERGQAVRYVVSPGVPRGRAAFTVAGCAGEALGRGARTAA